MTENKEPQEAKAAQAAAAAKSDKEPLFDTRKLIRFALFLVAFILLMLVGKIGWLGSYSQQAGKAISDVFSTNLGGYSLSLGSVLAAIAVLIFMFLLCTALNFLVRNIGRSDRSKTIRTMITSIISGLGVIIALVWALSALGLNPTAAFASVGIIALIIGFGAQSLIEDVISGIFIVMENQCNVGDVVVIGDFRGTVTRIGMRTTTIVDVGGNAKIINNSDIRNLQNRSMESSLAPCLIGITYEEDVRRVEAIIAEKLPGAYQANKDVWLAAPKYMGVEEIGDSSIVLKFLVPCEEKNFFAAKRRLNREVRLLFADNGIQIPYNQLDVHTK